MHKNEFNINIDLVQRLVTEQFPEFSKLPLTKVDSTGTVNAIYKLGEKLAIRLPRVAKWAGDITKEWQWLPWLAPHLSLEIPEPIALGRPSESYPVSWAIYKWINGHTYTDELVTDECQAAYKLAEFVTDLHAIDVPSEAPQGGRLPLAELDKITIQAIREARDLIDEASAVAAWKQSCEASVWDGRPVWIHTDLLRTNLLVESGCPRAVIDFGSSGVGDPAFDLTPAWTVFNLPGRDAFRGCILADEDTWQRARAYALHQAALTIPYYRHTNPQFVSLALRTVKEILSDMQFR